EGAGDLQRERHRALEEERAPQVLAGELVVLAEARDAPADAPEHGIEQQHEPDEQRREHPRHHPLAQLEELGVDQPRHAPASSPVSSRNTLSSSSCHGESSATYTPCAASARFSSAARATGAVART